MKYDSVFDVLGHVMVGPSSSHTAGACRIGYIAQKIFGEIPSEVEIQLHGSFSETFKGHKTDIAIIGGLLGLTPEDSRIPESPELANSSGMNYHISKKDLGPDYHPNTVLLKLSNISKDTYDPPVNSKNTEDEKKLTLIGSSIGGGNIIIKEINGMDAGFDGDSPTLIETHEDVPGVLAKIMKTISNFNINVNKMHLSRNVRTKVALSWIEVSEKISEDLVAKIRKITEIQSVRWFNV